jgi:hypothetical protein
MFPDEPESVDDGAKWPFQIIIKNKKISRVIAKYMWTEEGCVITNPYFYV